MENNVRYPFVATYAFENGPHSLSFLLPGKEVTVEGGNEVLPMRADFKEKDVWAVVEMLRQHGIEVAGLDLTPEYIKQAGAWVVRAIPLGLIPMSFGYGNEPLGMARYRQWTKLGTPWSNRTPFTHPFA